MREENKRRDDNLRDELKKDRLSTQKQLLDIRNDLKSFEGRWTQLEDRVKALEQDNKAEALIAANNVAQEERLRGLQSDIDKALSASKQPANEDRVSTLEHRLEMQDRENRKLNIIIRGLQATPESALERTSSFLRTDFMKDGCVLEARILKSKSKSKSKPCMILAKLASWEIKRDILSRKKEVLGDREIFIDNDLTQMQRAIEGHVRKVARQERTKGKVVILGREKLSIDGVWYRWNEVGENLINPRNSPTQARPPMSN